MPVFVMASALLRPSHLCQRRHNRVRANVASDRNASSEASVPHAAAEL
jgi:hypothetical protein